MAHSEITRCYKLSRGLVTADRILTVFAQRGYDSDFYMGRKDGIKFVGIKVTIAEPADRDSRESALEALDGVMAVIARKQKTSYSISRNIRPKK